MQCFFALLILSARNFSLSLFLFLPACALSILMSVRWGQRGSGRVGLVWLASWQL